MYKNELERFKKIIDEKYIYNSSKKALNELAEEFFSRDYQGISKKQVKEVIFEFEKRFFLNVLSGAMKSERTEIDNIFSQMKTSLEVILDKSVEESMLEKIAGKLGPLNFKIFSK
ncbi:MAG: hypothetical protein GQ533_15040 [Methanosarcinaceae archaeon]|nr:hypothetical protein [Methanosarcinaceae archaeon]